MYQTTLLSPKKRIVAVTISVLLCQTVYMFYVTARSVVLANIMSELGGMSYYSITIVLSSMTMAITTPLSGKLGDMFGRKRVYLIGLLAYCIALTFCAAAPNAFVFMFGIASSGIAYGLIYPQMVALLVDIYKPDDCPKMLGYISVASSISSLLGPVLGGVCVDFAGWRLVFIVMIPFAILNFVCAFIGVPEVKLVSGTDRRVDYKGTALFAIAVMSFLYMLTAAGSTFDWLSIPTASFITLTLVALIFLIKHERTAANPIIPMVLFKKPIYLLCLVVTVVGGLCFSGMNYLPIYYQVVKGMSSTMSGVMTIPRQVGTMLASVIIGAYFSKNKNYKLGTAVPMALFCVSLAMMSRFSSMTAIFVICVAEGIYGIANGAVMVAPNAMGQHYLNREEMGTGLAFISFASTFGNSLGAAVTGCVVSQYWNLSRVLPQELYEVLSGGQLKALATTSTLKNPIELAAIRSTLPTNLAGTFDSAVEALRLALNQGIRTAFLGAFVIAVVLLLVLLFFKWKKYEAKAEQ